MLISHIPFWDIAAGPLYHTCDLLVLGLLCWLLHVWLQHHPPSCFLEPVLILYVCSLISTGFSLQCFADGHNALMSRQFDNSVGDREWAWEHNDRRWSPFSRCPCLSMEEDFLIKNLVLARPAFTALNLKQSRHQAFGMFAVLLFKIISAHWKERNLYLPGILQDWRGRYCPHRVTQLTCASISRDTALAVGRSQGQKTSPRVYKKVVVWSGHTVLQYRSLIARCIWRKADRETRAVRAERDCQKKNNQIRRGVAQKVKRRVWAFSWHPSLPQSGP